MPSGPSGGPPAPTTVTLNGSVTWPGGRVAGARITILDGPNAGRTATANSNGDYSFDSTLTAGNANVSATATGYEERRQGVTLTNGVNVVNFTTRTLLPWSISGAGNTVFDMPRYFDRVRIRGEWNFRGTSNFAVRISGRLVVNAILRNNPIYEGIHLTNGGGVTEVIISDNVRWVFTEERAP